MIHYHTSLIKFPIWAMERLSFGMADDSADLLGLKTVLDSTLSKRAFTFVAPSGAHLDLLHWDYGNWH